jgi:hypothetical protein
VFQYKARYAPLPFGRRFVRRPSPGGPVHVTVPLMLCPLSTLSCNRRRRPAGVGVRKLCAPWSTATASTPSRTRGMCRMPRCVTGSIAWPPTGCWATGRPRSGRPPHVTQALAPHRERLVDHDPLQPGASHAQWRGQARATVPARQTGVSRSRTRVRDVLKPSRPRQSAPRPARSRPRCTGAGCSRPGRP